MSKATITAMGAQGDGLAEAGGERIFVPFSLPGEVVTVSDKGTHRELLSVDEASAERTDPPCAHFGVCGGCAVQHWKAAPYLAWKRGIVVAALERVGISAPVEPCIPCPPGSRRRAALTAVRTGGGISLGFNRRDSGDVVPLAECPVLDPELVAALPDIQHLASILVTGREPVSVLATLSETGLDLAFTIGRALPPAVERDAVNAFARTGFARLSVDGLPIGERERPIVRFGSLAVPLPPGPFLQSVPAVEAQMAALVGDHLKKAKTVCDLFAGCGTFALRLAGRSRVHAVEGDGAACGALREAADLPGIKPVTVEHRDLFEAPLTVKELNRFDGICLDPPRAGAEAQAVLIAKSDVRRVAYVSCNPVSLARDLSALMAGGYAVERVQPFDQFLWSPHVEVVVLLSKSVKTAKPIFGRR